MYKYTYIYTYIHINTHTGAPAWPSLSAPSKGSLRPTTSHMRRPKQCSKTSSIYPDRPPHSCIQLEKSQPWYKFNLLDSSFRARRLQHHYLPHNWTQRTIFDVRSTVAARRIRLATTWLSLYLGGKSTFDELGQCDHRGARRQRAACSTLERF